MATTQMNTRLEENVKMAGDAVFEKIGYTPSRVVRAIWGYAARCETAPEKVENLLREAEGLDVSEDEERSRRVALAEQGPRTFERFLDEVGIVDMPSFGGGGLSLAETREQAAVERAREKGWIDE